MLQNFILIILSTAFANNFVLAKFLGLCPLFGASNKLDTSIGMALATSFVLTLTAAISYLVQTYIIAPFHLDYLRIILFIVVIATAVQGSELYIKKASPLLYQNLGLFLPLITTNCAVLGLALLVTITPHSFIESIAYGLGSAIGFGFVLISFAALREKLTHPTIPYPFQGSSIALITAGLMALGFMGLSSMVVL